jgi:GDSL-like Lipase/Acylhydrolase family
MRRRWAGPLVTLVTLLVLAGVGEIGARIFYSPLVTPGYVKSNPQRRYELRPNFRGRTMNAYVNVNSQGLRDRERPVDLGPGTRRIAVYGDSFTFGNGVEIEETFPKILERHLARRGPVQVFDFGVPSYNTVMEWRYLEETYPVFKPHLVILQFTTANDTSPTDQPGSVSNRSPVVRMAKDVLRQSYAYDWFLFKYFAFASRISATGAATHTPLRRLGIDERMFADDFVGWIEAQQAFGEFAEFCRRHGTRLLVLVFANSIDVARVREEDIATPIVAKVLAALGARGVSHVVVLDDAFRAYAGRESLLWVSHRDKHFSALAHQLSADLIFRYLEAHPELLGWN